MVVGLRGGGNPPPSAASLSSLDPPLVPHAPRAGMSLPPPPPAIGLANSAQILLVSESSVAHLGARVESRRAAASAAAAKNGGGNGGIDGDAADAAAAAARSGAADDGGIHHSGAAAAVITAAAPMVVDAARFRANIVVRAVGGAGVGGDGGDNSGGGLESNGTTRLEAYAEESRAWSHLRIGGGPAGVNPDDADEGGGARLTAVRRCERCSMVGINQRNGTRTPEPMLSLAAFRAEQRAGGDGGGGGGGGGVTFGVLFNVDDPSASTFLSPRALAPPRHPLAGAAPLLVTPGSPAWMRHQWGASNLLSVGDGVYTTL